MMYSPQKSIHSSICQASRGQKSLKKPYLEASETNKRALYLDSAVTQTHTNVDMCNNGTTQSICQINEATDMKNHTKSLRDHHHH